MVVQSHKLGNVAGALRGKVAPLCQSLVDLCLTPQALGLFVECWGVVVV